MARHAAWAMLDADLAEVPGTVSVYCAQLGSPPAYVHAPNATHYAASMMKVAVLAALYRGDFDHDREVPVVNEFVSALPDAPPFGCRQRYDNDDAVWDRLGGTARLDWLARRMIVRSSNLATNLVLREVGLTSIADVWDAVGARHSTVGRGIEDTAAADAGINNLVTAADLAALFSAIATGATSDAARPDPAALASTAACQSMMDTLFGQETVDDLAAGLPSGTRVAHKSGWIRGVRHGAGVVFGCDAPPFVIAVCTSTPWAVNDPHDRACQLVARIAATAWTARHTLSVRPTPVRPTSVRPTPVRPTQPVGDSPGTPT